ncbi:hypothetical protein [Nocardioides sp. B-3]|uniref:hypothetical protein n=1 Tax=Nocardioides sp. B-3 TaxID=2895565 RepID=UPI003FA5E928
MNCMVGMDFRFLSEEFPEYVGSSFNDAFIAEMDASTGRPAEAPSSRRTISLSTRPTTPFRSTRPG